MDLSSLPRDSSPRDSPQKWQAYGVALESDLRFRADFALRPSEGGADLRVFAGDVPHGGDEIWRSTAPPEVNCSRAADGLVLRWPDAAFGVADDGVTVDADDPARAFERYFNPVMSLVLGTRGWTSFHAFVVQIDGLGIAVMGGSGYGKSSLGLALLGQGGLLVSDDLLALDADGIVQPGPLFVRTNTDNRSDRDPGGKARQLREAVHGPISLDLAIVISRDAEGFASVVGSAQAAGQVVKQAYSPFAASREAQRNTLHAATRIASTAPVIACERHFESPEDLAQRVLAFLR